MLNRFDVESAFDKFVHGEVGKILYNFCLEIAQSDNPRTFDETEKSIIDALTAIKQ